MNDGSRTIRSTCFTVLAVLISNACFAEETNAPSFAGETNAPSFAGETNAPPFGGRLTAGARVGSDVQDYQVDALVPVCAGESSSLFLDLRGYLLEDSEQEVSAGFVARRLLFDRAAIVGANVYYDNRWTENDNRFSQIGGGLEILSRWVDARANYYYPLDAPKVICEKVETQVTRSGNTRVTETVRKLKYEEALEGFDAEIGVWLPWLSSRAPTGVFVGYEDFASDVGGDLSGVTLRLESRLHRNLTLDAEWFENEDLNRTDFLVGLRLSFRLGKQGPVDTVVRPVEARMNDMVPRAFRVRTMRSGPVTSVVSRDATTVGGQDAPAAAPEEEPANCTLDSDGNVVCT